MSERSLWRRSFVAATNSLQPLAAFAAVVGISVYVFETPERAETRKLIKEKLALQCILLFEEINIAHVLEIGLGWPLQTDQIVDPDREKFLKDLRGKRSEVFWEIDRIYRDSCSGMPRLISRI